MAPRRTHRKSRSGCRTCKRRRIKCPEDGPPCRNCVSREIECEWPNPASHLQGSATSSTPDSKDLTSEPSPCRSNSLGEPHGLELELMHRWSTVTYKSVSTPVIDDFDVWQTIVPRVALNYDFLLHGLLAVAAMETAHSIGPFGSEKYISAAFEFQDRAFRSYQAQLRILQPESHDALIYFSILLIVLAFAIPPLGTASGEHGSKVQQMLGQFELIRGAGAVTMTQKERYTKDRLRNDPLFKNMKLMSDLPRSSLDPSTETAIASLSVLNEGRSASSPDESSDTRFKRLLYHGACKKALFWLEECFATCHNDDYRTWALAWIALPGNDYITAIKENDHVALLILMCWGVLIEPLGNDHWYADHFGKSLIEEISGSIPNDVDPITRDVVVWAQQHIFAEP